MVLRAGIFAVVALTQLALETGSYSIENVLHQTWENGRFGYFAVPRERIAAKLAELQQDSCHEGFLTLPDPADPVLQDIIGPASDEQHIVAVAYGKLGSESFEKFLPGEVTSQYETQADTVQFYIPMLDGIGPNANPNAGPSYKLSLASFVATDKPYLQTNFAIPTTQVDSIDVTSDGLVITDGTERFEVVWSNLGACETPEDFVVQDFDQYLNEITLSVRENPGYPYCREPAGDLLPFCVDPDISCACQVWTHGALRTCRENFFTVQYASPMFASLSLLSDGDDPLSEPTDAIVTEFNEGFFGVGIVEPCL